MKMLTNYWIALALVVSFSSCQHLEDVIHPSDPVEEAHDTFKTNEIGIVPLFLANKAGDTPTAPDEPLYENRKMNPVIAPDGHHLTFGEFSTAKGKLKMKCTKEGTQISLKMEGLIPFGLYSVWVLVFEEPGFTEDFAHETAEGVPGGNAGKYSSFVAGSDGTATYSQVVPEGPMSFFGEATDCLLDEYEVHVVGAYHIDGKTYGGELGPDGVAVEQFGFEYRQ